MKYYTNFARGCFHHWSISKAITELVQNFLDSDGEQEYEFGDDFIKLTNKNIRVSNKLLMMGKSDKRNDPDKRGQFGVGSIQAMVVLTDLDIGVDIYNNDVKWSPTWEPCDKFDDYIMVINETSCNNGNHFTVSITGLSSTDIDEVKQRCLVFQEREVLYSTPFGDIIESFSGDTGEVYCGDLFVCQNRSFKYSYNFKPKMLPLCQDRNSVSQWDLQNLTAKMIIQTGDVEFIKEAIKANTLDTSAVNVYYSADNTPADVDDSFAEEFLEEHGAVLVTSDYSEHQQNEELGNKSVYIQNTTQVKSIQSSDLYQNAIAKVDVIEKETFSDLFDRFIDLFADEVYDNASPELQQVYMLVKDRVERGDY